MCGGVGGGGGGRGPGGGRRVCGRISSSGIAPTFVTYESVESCYTHLSFCESLAIKIFLLVSALLLLGNFTRKRKNHSSIFFILRVVLSGAFESVD